MTTPSPFSAGMKCRCPRCGVGNLFEGAFSLTVKAHCDHCGLDLRKQDSGDGPAFFIMSILGFVLVPLFLIFAANAPVWMIAFLSIPVVLVPTLIMLRPAKAVMIALNYKHLGQP